MGIAQRRRIKVRLPTYFFKEFMHDFSTLACWHCPLFFVNTSDIPYTFICRKRLPDINFDMWYRRYFKFDRNWGENARNRWRYFASDIVQRMYNDWVVEHKAYREYTPMLFYYFIHNTEACSETFEIPKRIRQQYKNGRYQSTLTMKVEILL